MQSKTKLHCIGAALALVILLTGCSKVGHEPTTGSTANSRYESEMQISDAENSTKSSVDADSVRINDDVMWGIGKTVDEITAKYGSATAVKNNVYTFKNGYGKYVFSDKCKTIGEISAGDFLVGDLSAITLENFASKCGFEVVPLNDNDDPNTMYEGLRVAYYEHPSYDNVTINMLYKESGFDETATFTITYNGTI